MFNKGLSFRKFCEKELKDAGGRFLTKIFGFLNTQNGII